MRVRVYLKNMAKVTKTTNPLHFEDLEPHRFEDVVRGLLYDFRDWQSIEPTGKKGSDDGFDIRAWEKVKVVENESEEKEDEGEQQGEHPMEGNLWMIQCKREKEITPKKVEAILEDIDSKNPPYGYILAAATDFSKKAHDTFREILTKKGVTEFYLWGKSYLEDMLYLPKNDHILFTAFGISFNTRRRSRKTEIRFALNNKNKVFRIWGGADARYLEHKPALIRDFNDENYPYEDEYPDFEKNPHWFECVPFQHRALGLWFHIKERYAYVDLEKKEFDFCRDADLLHRQSDMRLGKDTQEKIEFEGKIRDFWEHLPIKNQAKLSVDGEIDFKDMLLIDDKGDYLYDFPHIYAEFSKSGERPFNRLAYILKTNQSETYLENDFKKISVFPKKFIKQKLGKIHKEKLDIPWRSIGLYEGNISQNGHIFSLDDKPTFKEGEVVIVTDDTISSSAVEDRYLEITHIYQTTVKKFIAEHSEHPFRGYIAQQIKREAKDNDKIAVFEVRSISKWDLEENKNG